jgi:hypothetical protein
MFMTHLDIGTEARRDPLHGISHLDLDSETRHDPLAELPDAEALEAPVVAAQVEFESNT